MNGYVTIHEIKSQTKGHFFDAGTMRFFNSRLPQTGYRVGAKAYFITSEKFDDFVNHYSSPRMYTVRVLDYTTGSIDTDGEFNKLTKSQAQTRLNPIIKA